ncbi:unnamed protein product [Paramecium primaurelia]|uniref:Uncharacterized protein n=1 Tax=Paramecium primaurelia TaxID=5886 RepID=A0A8S1LJQ8_PARPR|nr:unnamed protein product [Paramecium primaurelia]
MQNDDLDQQNTFLVDYFIHYYFYFDNFRKLYQIQIIIIFHIIIITDGHPYHIILQDLINQRRRNTRIMYQFIDKVEQVQIMEGRNQDRWRFDILENLN